MPIDNGIATNIVKLANAWDKAQSISTKIESQIADTNKQNFNIDLSGVQISVVDKFPAIVNNEISRESMLKYLQSTVQAIEHDKQVIITLHQAFSSQQGYINEFGIMAVSQLLNNLINLDKELVKMSKIVSDVLLNWEQIDFNKSTMGEAIDEHAAISSSSSDGLNNMTFEDDIDDETI